MDTSKKRVSKEQRHQMILSTACRLFAEKGYENTTYQDIATELHTSKALISQHFSGKDEIYQELLAQWAEEKKKPIELQVINGSVLDTLYYFADTLIHHMDTFISVITKVDTTLSNAIYSRHGMEQALSAIIRESTDIVQDTLVPIIRMGQLNGEIRPGDPLELASLFYFSINGILHARKQFPDIMVPRTELYLDMLRRIKDE